MSHSGHKSRKYILLIAVVSGLTFSRNATAAITVCSSGCPYSTVQAAVDAAPDGETIRILEGTFVGAVNITNKNLILKGSGTSYTVLDRGPVSVSPSPPAIELNCTRVFQITITELTITGGTPFHGFGGGGLENHGCTVNVNSTAIMNNGSRGGGGISNDAGTMTVKNTTIFNNGSELGGGGISNSATLTLISSVVSSNSTWSVGKGGGIENGGTLVVHDSTIADNSGPDGGGVANAVGATARIIDSIITNNSSTSPDGEGGGLFNVGSLILRGTLVIANESGHLGGGIFTKAGGSLVLNGSIVTRNTAGSSGGGLYSDGTTSVNSSTIANNTPGNCAGAGYGCP